MIDGDQVDPRRQREHTGQAAQERVDLGGRRHDGGDVRAPRPTPRRAHR